LHNRYSHVAGSAFLKISKGFNKRLIYRKRPAWK
jgi:hypothetical protein